MEVFYKYTRAAYDDGGVEEERGAASRHIMTQMMKY